MLILIKLKDTQTCTCLSSHCDACPMTFYPVMSCAPLQLSPDTHSSVQRRWLSHGSQGGPQGCIALKWSAEGSVTLSSNKFRTTLCHTAQCLCNFRCHAMTLCSSKKEKKKELILLRHPRLELQQVFQFHFEWERHLGNSLSGQWECQIQRL